jgi:hypothetical protein
MKNTNNIGVLTFGNNDAHQTLLSLSKEGLKVFEKDLADLLKKTNEEMVKANFFEAHHFANQRIGERNFRVELWVDLSPNKNPLVILQQFNELTIDEYLDSINSDKDLKNEGFLRLHP